MLLVALAASAICYAWIVLDNTFDDVFVVYGRSFRAARQMRAWSAFASCGWRLLILVGVIALNVSLAYQATIRSEAGADALTIAMWSGAVLLAFGLVPWTFVMSKTHKRQLLLANVRTLS